jgi:hypothetical protein
VFAEDDPAVPLELEVVVEDGSERLDQVGLAMEGHRVLRRVGLFPVDSNGAAALALAREVGWFSPLQTLLDLTDAFCGGSGDENELAQRHQLAPHFRRIGAKRLRDGGVLNSRHDGASFTPWLPLLIRDDLRPVPQPRNLMRRPDLHLRHLTRIFIEGGNAQDQGVHSRALRDELASAIAAEVAELARRGLV